jgi:hypothetical protein
VSHSTNPLTLAVSCVTFFLQLVPTESELCVAGFGGNIQSSATQGTTSQPEERGNARRPLEEEKTSIVLGSWESPTGRLSLLFQGEAVQRVFLTLHTTIY